MVRLRFLYRRHYVATFRCICTNYTAAYNTLNVCSPSRCFVVVATERIIKRKVRRLVSWLLQSHIHHHLQTGESLKRCERKIERTAMTRSLATDTPASKNPSPQSTKASMFQPRRTGKPLLWRWWSRLVASIAVAMLTDCCL